MLPISIGPLKVDMGMEDAGDNVPLICACAAPPPVFVRIGLGTGFWEPARVAEVLRTPFYSPLLGGITLGAWATPSGTNVATIHSRDAFYHVHWYVYPLLAGMNLLTDLACVTRESFDILYLSELAPLWADDKLAFLINPEAALFANPIAQAACAADCAAATVGFPLDALFWCAGCQGSMYPLDGNVKHHEGGVDSSLLLVQRMAAKLHRQLIARDTSGRGAMCGPLPQPILRKSQHKTQMLYPPPYPINAQPFGRVTLPWSARRGLGLSHPEEEGVLRVLKRLSLISVYLVIPPGLEAAEVDLDDLGAALERSQAAVAQAQSMRRDTNFNRTIRERSDPALTGAWQFSRDGSTSFSATDFPELDRMAKAQADIRSLLVDPRLQDASGPGTYDFIAHLR